MIKQGSRSFWRLWILLFVILCVTVLISSCTGRYAVRWEELVSFLQGKDSMGGSLFFYIRLPRIVFVILSGAVLALAGTVYQSLFQNPLVSPDILGVTSGCSLGAAIAIVFFSAQAWLVQGLAFLFGLLAVALSLAVARFAGGDKTLRFVVSGIITGAMASSFLMLLKYMADPYKQLPAIDFWLMGGFHNVGWEDIGKTLPTMLLASGVLLLLGWKLKVMSTGEQEASLLGINTNVVRLTAILCATLLVGAVVSVAGAVGWIGIFVPHIVKLIWRDDIPRTMPLSLLAGGAILLGADTLARTLRSSEIPISIVTSMIGALFLIYFFTRKKKPL